MDAFIFTLTLFLFFGLVGFALVAVFKPRLRVIQGILVSPAIGIAVSILPVFFLNRAGIPVKEFGAILFAVLAILSSIVLWIRRPLFPARRLWPHALILVAALVLAAWPMFSYGFDWVSFSNDDMANYCLGAQRFLNHGFFDEPNLDDLFAGRDYSLAYWFMHASAGVRSGSELMLAFVWSVSALNAHQLFMPVIMALHLALISAAGALVAGFGNRNKTPLIAMALLAVSPMTTLGALYQLIGQVGGLALLCAAVTLMYRPTALRPVSRHLQGAIPAALIFSALFVWYPEVLPFFGLGWMVYVALLYRHSRRQALRVTIPAVIVGGVVLLTLNKYVIAALMFMFGQASGGMKSSDLSAVLFPFFLVPSGLPAFWGLLPITGNVHEPFVSLSIIGALLLFFWLLRWVVPMQLKRGTVSVAVLIIMLAMGLLLFLRNNDFGLFKLAMYAQPFLIGVLAIDLAAYSWRGAIPRFSFAIPLFFVPVLISQFGYVSKSTGEFFGGLNEIPYASRVKINAQFGQAIKDAAALHKQGAQLISFSSNVVLAKFQSLYTGGIDTFFPARDFFGNIRSFGVGKGDREKAEKAKQFYSRSIDGNAFSALDARLFNESLPWYVDTNIRSDIFNGYSKNINEEKYFHFTQYPSNKLLFIHSDLGNHYYLGNRHKISVFQMENDPLFSGKQFSALGRHFLFEIVNPSPKVRMTMELTSTVVKQFTSELPSPKVEQVSIGFVGRGSGRVFSAPISPKVIDNVSYISVDMGRDGRQLPNRSMGLSLLYGREIRNDYRRIATFGRDISLITEEQYQAVKPPTQLQNFPADLADKNLEYSGIYEDGWISERSFFVLTKEPQAKQLLIRGVMPKISDPAFSTTLHLSIDGVELARKAIGLGQFEVKLFLLNVQAGRRRIDLSFDSYQTLPGADGRPTGGKIDFIGFSQN